MMAKTALLPGFRFHPTDVELILYFLKRKVMGKPFCVEAVIEIDLYKFAPWDLPDKSCLRSKDLEWYFFCPRGKKYATGLRTNRATDIGYWKITGKDRTIDHNSCIVGRKKTLVFHVGKPPRGDRTDWVMYEYSLEEGALVAAGFSKDDYVLCKIFRKSGPGPRIGEQYGAPFNEEEWEDDTNTKITLSPFISLSRWEPVGETVVVPTGKHCITSGGGEVPITHEPPQSDDTLDFLDEDGMFLEQLVEILSDPPPPVNVRSKMSDVFAQQMNDEVNIDRIYSELEDLADQAGGRPTDNLSYPISMDSEYALQPVLSDLGDENYVELNDFWSLGWSCPIDLAEPNDLLGQIEMHNSYHCTTDSTVSHLMRPDSHHGQPAFNSEVSENI